ncbi:MAG: hypothetical protein HOF15_03845 [Planctomycetaceae bacterium]|jgi:hypothetical protein|nr:hypothetical protein [Planctomycetaceae bacterium]MBT4693050.1 hypothetical protein [Planctomycetaceae bacterium]MBT5123713.1 hypothetical protein [Planctomycetaceae bacterium]MBT5884633.1 hypothetical protein [Planctomycetaceae bacterium]
MDSELVVLVVWSLLIATIALAFFIVAYKRKGRIAVLMLPLVLFIYSWPLRFLLEKSIVDGIMQKEELLVGEMGRQLAVVEIIFKSIPNIIMPFLWFLSLLLIFKKDKPAITTTESEEPPKPVE